MVQTVSTCGTGISMSPSGTKSGGCASMTQTVASRGSTKSSSGICRPAALIGTRRSGSRPDGLLYLTIGSSCNACLEDDERRAAMLRYTPDGKFIDIYATGLRDSAGFDWRGDGALYATDNGRDLLGDDFPPCELNQIEQGGFYGWPFANGARVPDPDLGTGRGAVIAASIPPVFGFRAHNAPLGIVFLKSEHQRAELRGAALVALHGSWNRSQKDGYKVVALHWDADGSIHASDFRHRFSRR